MEDGILKAIELAGGQAKLAALLGLRRQQINAWANGRERVPLRHLRAIQEATGARREQIRPDIFLPAE